MPEIRAARRRVRRFVPVAVGVVAGCLVTMPAPPAAAAPIHVDCDAGGNLQSKIDAAPIDATILVKGTCRGPFSVSGKTLTLQGNPEATLDGQLTDGTLSLDAEDSTLHLIDLTVTGGRRLGEGGGIHVVDGSLTLLRTTVRGNQAIGLGAGGHSFGGGIGLEGTGTLTVTSSLITGNQARTEPASGDAFADGGGIQSDVPVTLDHTIVRGNTARAVSVDQAASAVGGGVEAASLVATASTISNNVAFTQSDTSFAASSGGGLDLGKDQSTLTGTNVVGNQANAVGAQAQAVGGGVDGAGRLTLQHSSVNGNTVEANADGSSANAYGGGIDSGATGHLVLVRSTVGNNGATAFSTNDNTDAGGGGIDAGGTVSLINSTVAGNTLDSRSGGADATSTASGGGLHGDPAQIVSSTIARNAVQVSAVHQQGSGGGVSSSDLTIRQTILAANTAGDGPDCFASTTSQGHNLVQKPLACLDVPKPTDVTGQPPKLGPLQANGGPTQTMAIAAASPAFDAIPPAACAVAFDQRGTPRPQGAKCDIGAFERQ